MALKADRVIIETDITHNCSSVAERGVTLVFSTTSGSGVAIGDSAGAVELAAAPSGMVVAGILLNDIVNVDQTRYHRNFHKDELQINERCTLLRKGVITTDKITGTPTVGATAYLTANGVLTPTLSTSGGLAATPKVGQFASVKDENSFVKVEINLPIV